MSKFVTPSERAQIVEAIKAGTSCRRIAADFKRSTATISKIAKDEGLHFNRAATAAATQAKVADNRERRARITSKMLDDIERLQTQMFAPVTVHNFGGRDNTYNEARLDEPTFRDKRDITAAISNLMGRVLDTERIDRPDAGDGQIRILVEAIGKARQEHQAPAE